MLSACSSDDATINGGGKAQNDAVQEIVLQVASSGDGLTTRAGRELESSEAAQDIKNVKVFVCDNTNKIKFVKDFNDWMGADASDYANGRKASFTIPDADRLDAGTYHIYALGYSENSDYDLSAITGLAKDGTFNENAAISLKTDKTDAEEIFAGSADLTVKNGEKAEGTVTLNRQVAGSYGYIEDIPYYEGAAALELVASNSSNQLILGNFANKDIEAQTSDIKYVVNGESANTDKVIYKIDLSQWFTEIKDDGKGFIAAGDNWKGNAAKYKTGSVFAGNFIIPFAKTDGQTFTLKLVNEEGTELKSWKVYLPEKDGQLTAHNFSNWNGTGFTTSTVTDTQSSYSVVRNHLYGIGTRTSGNPKNPGTDPGDKPQSLKKDQVLTLQVNDNWEVIHQMVLE